MPADQRSNVTYLRRAVWQFVARHPLTFFVLSRLKWRRYHKLVIHDHTELVIEGFPRSANTFAVAALCFLDDRITMGQIARHTHAPAQVSQAASRNLPTVVLVRAPRAAVSSLAIREHLGLEIVLRQYIDFYESIRRFRAHFVIAPFDEVTSDFSRVVQRVNERFGTAFQHRQLTKDDERSIFLMIDEMERVDSGGALRQSHVARPSQKRTEAKDALIEELKSPRYASLVARAERLHAEYVEGAGARPQSIYDT